MNRKSLLVGFSLVELLVAMLVVSIVLAAVATLAYAFSTAYDSSGDISQKQSVFRFAVLRLSHLIRGSMLVCAKSPYELVLWQADDNGDNKINVRMSVKLHVWKQQNTETVPILFGTRIALHLNK